MSIKRLRTEVSITKIDWKGPSGKVYYPDGRAVEVKPPEGDGWQVVGMSQVEVFWSRVIQITYPG
ncbi:MAG: hypothetical protein ACXABY_01565 [Candidatus Thorarchaeota archaeon]|jgi:hypothetical protein